MAQPVIKGYIDRIDDTGVTTFNMNFSSSYLALGQTTRQWRCVSVNSSNGDVYACVYNGDIYKQTAGSGSFVPLEQTTRNWEGVSVNSSNGDVYACIYMANGVYKQTAGSGDFVLIPNSPAGTRISVNSSNGDVYVVSNMNGVYKQTGGSGDFVALETSLTYFSDVSVNSSNNDVYVVTYNPYAIYKQAGGSGGFVAVDSSKQWKYISVDSSNGDVYAQVNNELSCTYKQTGGSGNFVSLNVPMLFGGVSINSSNKILYTVESNNDIYKINVLINPGDLLLAIIAKDDDPQMTSSHGMTRDVYAMGLDHATFAFHKIVTAEDITRGYMTFNGDSEDYLGRMYIIKADTFDSTSPLVVGTGATGASAAPYAPSITVGIDALVFAVTGMDDNDIPYAITTSGWTSEFNNSVTDAGCVIAKRDAVTSGATGQVDFSTAASDGWAAFQVAVNPWQIPYAPTLVSPVSGSTVNDITPSFRFIGRDNNLDSMEYNFQIIKYGQGAFNALGQTISAWQAVAVNPINGDVYASNYANDVYKKIAEQNNFIALGLPAVNPYGIAINSSNGDVYIVDSDGDIYKQTGGNGSFVPLGETVRSWRGIAINSSNNDIYACVYQGDIYKQTGGSGSFVPLGETVRDWWGMAVNSSNGDVYAYEYSKLIYKQTGGSGSFIALESELNPPINPRGISVNSSNGDVYACAFGGDIYKQTAGSGTFNALGQTARQWSGISVNSSNGDVYACVAGGDIYEYYQLFINSYSSTDSGFENITTPANTHPFNSGDTIQYTVQAGNALTSGSTYYWRVRAIDP